MNSISYLISHILELIVQEFNLSSQQAEKINLSINLDPEKGDLSTNAAMIIAKIINQKPRDVAEKISFILKEDLVHEDYENKISPHIKSCVVAGPGFLNIFLTEETWHTAAHELAVHPLNGFKLFPEEKKNSYLIEFVSANPTGPLSLAHGRNAIIGDVLSRVLTFLGHKVEKEFYINDAGKQIKNLGESLKKKSLSTSEGEISYDNEYMDALAKKCVHEFSEESLKEKDDLFFQNYAKSFFLEKIKKDLKAYKVEFDSWFSEKSIFESGKVSEAIEKLNENGYLFEDDGATWFKSTEFGDDKDRVIKKKDGELTYIASDIAYHQNKFERGFDFIIDVLGQDHHSYAKRLVATMQALGFDSEKLKIIIYQLVRMKQGDALVRMSKRSGAFHSLEDVIKTVGVDAARYFYINKKADAHLELDLDKALKKDNENPFYYIQYAYVRTFGVLKKGKEVSELASYIDKLLSKEINEADTLSLEHKFNQDEISLLKRIFFLRSILVSVSKNFQTNLISNYIYELAKDFHVYYNSHKIVDGEDLFMTRSRLLLTCLVRNTLDLCLDLLGISKPEKM